jgi:lipoprotein-anchoring transpeptidase ErfK/SrfK
VTRARTPATPKAPLRRGPSEALRGAEAISPGFRPASSRRAAEHSARPLASTRRPANKHQPRLVRARPGRTLAVRARPGGRVIGRLGARTRFGSPQVVPAVAIRGHWLGVASSARTDGRLGWVDSHSPAVRVGGAPVSIHADLSRRRIEVSRADRIVQRLRVAVGRPGSPTPTGRFAITDKLRGADHGPYYGCCILALSGTQPNLPPGWQGGNRLAIHGTDAPSSIGTASSAGCLRTGDAALRRLTRRVPLGTPVEIRP